MASLLSAVPTAGQDRSGAIPVAHLVNFNEHLNPDVKVSGRILVGVLAARENAASPSSEPLLLLPERGVGGVQSICLQTVSRDGRYYSEGILPGAALAGARGLVRVRFKTQHGVLLKGLRRDELAILAAAGDCGANIDAIPRVFVVDRAEAPASSASKILVLLNSERLDTEAVYAGADGREIRTRCIPIEDGRRTAFDTVCELPPPRAAETDVRIERRRYERRLNPLVFRLVLGG
jgi:hypothetical protein